jgi:hypothetical protein
MMVLQGLYFRLADYESVVWMVYALPECSPGRVFSRGSELMSYPVHNILPGHIISITALKSVILAGVFKAGAVLALFFILAK